MHTHVVSRCQRGVLQGPLGGCDQAAVRCVSVRAVTGVRAGLVDGGYRIEGGALSQGGSGQTEDFVNEIVRALQGAFNDEKGNSRFDIGDGNKVGADYVSP
jgi:hypothetical protein